MTNSKIQAKLDKLEQMEAKNRKRSRQYLERKRNQGKKQISCLISQKAYDEICRLRDKNNLKGKGLTIGQIIENAILSGGGGEVN